jgi:hypothetical protein
MPYQATSKRAANAARSSENCDSVHLTFLQAAECSVIGFVSPRLLGCMGDVAMSVPAIASVIFNAAISAQIFPSLRSP